MYHKATTGAMVLTTPCVCHAEWKRRRVSAVKDLMKQTERALSEGVDMSYQRMLYFHLNKSLKYNKKGFYSRIIKERRQNS